MNKGKTCSKCGNSYPATIEYFITRKDSKDGFRSFCKKCLRHLYKKYYDKNKAIIVSRQKVYCLKHTEKIRKYQKKYFLKYKSKLAAYQQKYRKDNDMEIKKNKKIYRETHSEKIREAKKIYANKNKEKRNHDEKNKRKINMGYRITQNLRSRLNIALRLQKARKLDHTLALVGCPIGKLIKHIESQFCSNMSWDNYGKYGWHIDHIKPCSAFNLELLEEQKKCFHYTNFQPLWAKDNLRKNSFYGGELIRKGVK